MLWAAFSVAFYGFLRVSELTSLRWCDVSHFGDQISITLHQSKTKDAVSASTRQTHPLAHVMLLNVIAASVVVPLLEPCSFKQADLPHYLVLLSPELFGNCFSKLGSIPSLISHTGSPVAAATTAAAAGLPVWLIKNLGWWSSNAYLSYIHQQLALTSEICKLLVRTDASQQPIWDPDS